MTDTVAMLIAMLWAAAGAYVLDCAWAYRTSEDRVGNYRLLSLLGRHCPRWAFFTWVWLWYGRGNEWGQIRLRPSVRVVLAPWLWLWGK